MPDALRQNAHSAGIDVDYGIHCFFETVEIVDVNHRGVGGVGHILHYAVDFAAVMHKVLAYHITRYNLGRRGHALCADNGSLRCGGGCIAHRTQSPLVGLYIGKSGRSV